MKIRVPSRFKWVTYQPATACLVEPLCNQGDDDLKSLFGPGTAAPQCGSCSQYPPRRIVLPRQCDLPQREPLKRFDEILRQGVLCHAAAGCSELIFPPRQGVLCRSGADSHGCTMFGVLALLSRVLVFRLVTADAALGCGDPRKANDPRDLVALRLLYPLDMRKSLNKSVPLFLLPAAPGLAHIGEVPAQESSPYSQWERGVPCAKRRGIIDLC